MEPPEQETLIERLKITGWQHWGKIKQEGDDIAIKYKVIFHQQLISEALFYHLSHYFSLCFRSSDVQPTNTDWNHFSSQLRIGHVIRAAVFLCQYWQVNIRHIKHAAMLRRAPQPSVSLTVKLIQTDNVWWGPPGNVKISHNFNNLKTNFTFRCFVVVFCVT